MVNNNKIPLSSSFVVEGDYDVDLEIRLVQSRFTEPREARRTSVAPGVARNRRTAERFIRALSADLPSDVEELIAYFDNCEPCQLCLESCAIYDGELVALSERELGRAARVGRWLAACVGCGMCEQACPREMPLAALHDRLASLVRQVVVH